MEEINEEIKENLLAALDIFRLIIIINQRDEKQNYELHHYIIILRVHNGAPAMARWISWFASRRPRTWQTQIAACNTRCESKKQVVASRLTLTRNGTP